MSNQNDDFPTCAICGGDSWRTVYEGPIRDGTFGVWREARVCRCDTCGVDRVAERVCLPIESYESVEYRHLLKQDHDADHHNAAHDELARFTLDTIWPTSLRGKTVADLGCGGGALLDHICGLASKIVAIDPSELFAPSLKSRGYVWFPSATAAAKEYAGIVDLVLSTQVIEHVDDPLAFLRGIAKLLAPGGVAVVSTPNRCDILMELLPDTFPSFFYRTQHRWAFDAGSLGHAAKRAGLQINALRHVHRYGLANTLHWFKEGQPRGRAPMVPLDGAIDHHWQAWLESTGRADNLYLIAQRADVGHSR